MSRYTIKLFIWGAFLFSVTTAANIPAVGAGNLDTSFNGSGKSVFNIESTPAPGSFMDIVVIAGNKFLVTGRAAISSGSYYGVTISRFNSDGSLDTSFGAGGKVITDAGVTAEGMAIAVQSDGKIVVAANGGSSPNRMTVVLRYTADGVLDTTFGTNGVFLSSVMKVAKDISVLADDKIVVAGISDVPNLGRTQVLKLTANGALDTTFGSGNGITSSTYTYGSDTNKMAIQSDGKIVVSGTNLFTVPKGLVHRFNPDGSPDPAFGTSGIREIDIGTSFYAGGLALQPDGKIVIAAFVTASPGNNTMIMLIRLNSGGSNDGTFGDSGMIFRELSPDYDRAQNLAIQGDGKLVISGQYDDNQAMLARFDSNGSVDTTFGSNGLLLLPAFNAPAIAVQDTTLIVTGSVSSNPYLARVSPAGGILLFRNETYVTGRNDQARDVAIQPDGRIVAAGVSVSASGNGVASVARLLPDGTLDNTFGTGGKVTVSDGTSFTELYAVAVQPDGKIVVVGRGTQQFTFTYYSLFAARFNADGTLDRAFGSGGKITITSPANLIGYDLKLQSDGKIVVAGTVQRVVGDGIFEYDMFAARFHPNGLPDSGFGGSGGGGGGIVIYAFGSAGSPSFEEAKALSILPNGKIILAGTHLLRVESNGAVDTTFSPSPVPLVFSATDVKVQPDGKILLSGSSNSNFALARYNPNASIDMNFGTAGTAILDFGGADIANALYLEADGDIVAGGSTLLGGSPSRKKFALARFKPNGSPDPIFGAGGKVITDFGGEAEILGIARQADGKIVAAGSAKLSIDRDYALARYLTQGAAAPFDFDGDGKTDVSIFRPSAGEWWYLKSSNNGNAAFHFGAAGDRMVPADYTGDGKIDIAFYRAGEWFVLRSEDNSYYSHPFGLSNDISAPGDYDADGKADQAVFRPSTGTWYVHRSSGGVTIQQFGQNGDQPVAADYDGDGRVDIAVYRPSNGQWWIQRSSAGVIAYTFGAGGGTDKTVQGDYTGDGKADVAIWRPASGEWFVLRSEDNSYYSFPFGTSSDMPTPGDYDGDGKTDAAVFRPSNSVWYLQRSTSGFAAVQFGASGDSPVPNAFVR